MRKTTLKESDKGKVFGCLSKEQQEEIASSSRELGCCLFATECGSKEGRLLWIVTGVYESVEDFPFDEAFWPLGVWFKEDDKPAEIVLDVDKHGHLRKPNRNSGGVIGLGHEVVIDGKYYRQHSAIFTLANGESRYTTAAVSGWTNKEKTRIFLETAQGLEITGFPVFADKVLCVEVI
jgi:hypothetical protein